MAYANPTLTSLSDTMKEVHDLVTDIADASAQIAAATLNLHVQKRDKDGVFHGSLTTPEEVLGNLNQWISRIMDNQAAIGAKLNAIATAAQTNDSLTHAKLNALTSNLAAVGSVVAKGSPAAAALAVDYDKLATALTKAQQAFTVISTVTPGGTK